MGNATDRSHGEPPGVHTAPRSNPTDTRYPLPALLAGLVGAGAAGGGGALLGWPAAAAGGVALVVGVLLASSLKYADQWEKAVVLRLGRYRGLRGPGFFVVVPVLDRVSYHIDERIRTTAFGAESCLTRDTVPVDVDAIAFWVVNDPQHAALRVQNYQEAVMLAAQTALRDAIGKHDLAEMIQARKELGDSLQEALDQKMHDWGIEVQSVEIRDVTIPQALEDAMSRQAQAERERQARVILGTAEREVAAKFVEAADQYRDSPMALRLRGMNMLYESIVKRGSLMVVPSALSDAANLPGMLGMAGASDLAREGTGKREREGDGEPPSAAGMDVGAPGGPPSAEE